MVSVRPRRRRQHRRSFRRNPVSRHEPFTALLEEARVVAWRGTSPDEVWLPSRDELVRVSVDTIRRVAAERDYVRFFVENRTFLLRATMARIEEHLGADRFVRVHRSALVAKSDVVALRHTGGGAWAVVHRDGVETLIGRTYHAAVRQALGVPSKGGSIASDTEHRKS